MKKIKKINYSLARFFYKNLSRKYREKFLKKISCYPPNQASDVATKTIVCEPELPVLQDFPLAHSDATNPILIPTQTPTPEIQEVTNVTGKDYFCVLSHGACGSVWLSNIFNNHPDITCSVGTDHPAVAVSYNDRDKNDEVMQNIVNQIASSKDIKYGANFAVDEQFIPEINVNNYRKYLNAVSYGSGTIIAEALKKRGIEINIPYRASMSESFSFFFQEMEGFFPQSTYYGNIHGLSCEQIAPLVEKNHPFLKNVVFADLIRHPITRLESIINHYRLIYDLNLFERKKIEDSIDSNSEKRIYFERNYRTNFDIIDNKIRFYCNYIVRDKGWTRIYADDIRALKVQRILFERIKNEPEYLAWLISYLTRGKVSASKEFLDSIYNDKDLFEKAGRMGKLKIDQKSARDQWDEWPQWQKKVFRDQCEEYDLYSLYTEYSYDLSFVKNYE